MFVSLLEACIRLIDSMHLVYGSCGREIFYYRLGVLLFFLFGLRVFKGFWGGAFAWNPVFSLVY